MRKLPSRTRALEETYPIGEDTAAYVQTPVKVQWEDHEENIDGTSTTTTYVIVSDSGEETIKVVHNLTSDTHAFEDKGYLYDFDGFLLNGPQVLRLAVPVFAGRPVKVDPAFVERRRKELGINAWLDIMSLRANPVIVPTRFKNHNFWQ